MTLTAQSDYKVFDREMKDNIEKALGANDRKNKVVELRFNGDYVVDVEIVADKDLYDDNTQSDIEEYDVYDVKNIDNTKDGKLMLTGRTLYSSTDDEGLTIASDAKAVVIQMENRKEVTDEYASVREAMSALGDPSDRDGLQYKGRIVAILNDQGVAEWVVFCSDTDVKTGHVDDKFESDDSWKATVDTRTMRVDVDWKLAVAGEYPTANEVKAVVADALNEVGLMVTSWGDESKSFGSGERTITVVDPDLSIAIPITYTVQAHWSVAE